MLDSDKPENLFAEPVGATPLNPDEQAGLIPTWVSTREDLNQVEADNILSSRKWAYRKSRGTKDILRIDFLLALHHRMFKDVWRWAGTYRESGKSIGVDPTQISAGLMQLNNDAQYWLKDNVYAPEEIAVRYHHQLVYIHPFPNGNGRHSRLMADVLHTKIGGNAFSWGSKTLTEANVTRHAYIEALRAADNYNIEPLLEFASS